MKQLALLLLAFVPAVLGQFIPDEASRTTRSFPAPIPGGKSTIETRELLVQGWNEQGKPVQGNVVVFFDFETRYFMWRYAQSPYVPAKIYLADVQAWFARCYSTGKSLIYIEAQSPGLRIWESTQRASSMEDAEQQALGTMKAQAHLITDTGLWSSPRKVVTLPNLGLDFYMPLGNSFRRVIRVLSILPVAGGLEVTIEGEWQEKLVLSPSYELLKATRVDPQP